MAPRSRALLALLLIPLCAHAKHYTLGPEDPAGYLVLEAARAGDEVLIQPGTYQYRVALSQTDPGKVILRAADPANPPVWDMTGVDLTTAPGSDTTPGYDSRCWHVVGSHYDLFGIVVRGCAAFGVQVENGASDITFTQWEWDSNSTGLLGYANGLVVEYAYVHDNTGKGLAIYGGSLDLRYSVVRDNGFNLIGEAATSLIEYNFFGHTTGFQGFYAPCTVDCLGDSSLPPVVQPVTFVGNIFDVGQQGNNSQIFNVYRDTGDGYDPVDLSGRTSGLAITMAYNTVLGNAANSNAIMWNIDVENVAGTMELDDNVFLNLQQPMDTYDRPGMTWDFAGTNNWLGTMTDPTGLTGSLMGDDPSFADPGTEDYRPSATSPLRGAAEPGVSVVPTKEYDLTETFTGLYRDRAAATDIGAFQFGTSGPGIAAPIPDFPDAGIPTQPAAPSRLDLGVAWGCSATGGGQPAWPMGMGLLCLAMRHRRARQRFS